MQYLKSLMRKFVLCVVFAAASVATSHAQSAQSEQERFGFRGLEIFPLDNHISQMRSADINGDGKLDLVMANNTRAKINILINQTGETNITRPATVSYRKDSNELLPDARFRVESIASEKRIAALVVADLNGDNRPDLAYYGEPKELVVQYNEGTNGWSMPKRWQIGDETSLTPNALTAGDLNGDKRTDLLLLSENNIFFLRQNADNMLSEPEKIPFVGTVKSIQVLDINGDGRDDLLQVNWDDPNPFRFRLQTGQGQLGPEYHFTMPAIRAYWADDLDQDKKTEIMTIAQHSGRAQVANFAQKDAESLGEAFKQGQFQVLPLNKTSKARRGILWADVNRDGLSDLLVAEPDSGQLTLLMQNTDGTLVATNTFPTFTGVTDLAASDWNGDGRLELFVLSPDERQIGLTEFDAAKGRIAFPDVLPLDGKPLVMTVGTLDPSVGPVLAVISEQDTNRFLITRTASGKTHKQKLSETFKATPSSMSIHDVDQDGLSDLVVLVPYEKIKVLRQVAGKDFEEQDIMPPGGNADQPWLSIADVDGDQKPELLLAQRNFVRAVVMKVEPARETAEPTASPASSTAAVTNAAVSAKATNLSATSGSTTNASTNTTASASTVTNTPKATWSFTVKEQINGASSNSRIVGATPVQRGSNSTASLFLLDAERKTITLCERDKSGVWQVVRNLQLPVTAFHQLRPLGIGSPNVNSVGFIGVNALGWLSLDGKIWEIAELDHYETPIKDGRLNDLISGDLNNDNRKDLVFLETSKNYLDIVMFEPPHRIVPANRWPVFEERTFRSRRAEMAEPREAVVADVTGDGKSDLIVLVHDRLLLYPQD
jgi:hypothetical protein